MRQTRAITPSYQHHSSHTAFSQPQQHSPPTKKYYNKDEVTQILKFTVQSKLSHLYKDIEEKQTLIKKLNEQLAYNDKALQNANRLLAEHKNREG